MLAFRFVGLAWAVAAAAAPPPPLNVLVVYASDLYGQTEQVAGALAHGALQVTPHVRLLNTTSASYRADIKGWPAHALLLGSGVYNGNVAPSMLEFINSFDFSDDLSTVVGGSFATGSGAAAGLQVSRDPDLQRAWPRSF